MIVFGWSSSRGLRAIFLSSRTVDRVEGHPVPSWLDLFRRLRSFESYGWAERWTVPRISGYGAASRSRWRLWLPLGTDGHLRPRALRINGYPAPCYRVDSIACPGAGGVLNRGACPLLASRCLQPVLDCCCRLCVALRFMHNANRPAASRSQRAGTGESSR